MVILLAVISAFLYRFGGMSKEEGKRVFPYLPSFLFKSWVRDYLCPICVIFSAQTIGGWHWSLIPTYILTFASLTTYWKFGNEDVEWWNWLITGFVMGLALLPYAWALGLWRGYILRCIALSITVCAISEYSDNVFVEECGRGFLLTISTLLISL